MSKEMIPLVSVIIPMYNAAKFIPQTLESLLHQTMQDFEVIVIDDCSTDNSVEIVEGFAEKFDGRLHVIKLPENTGAPGLPRNVGIQYSRGKYIAFLDSDDLFTKTALGELTTLAEEFQVDVVHTDTFLMLFEKNPKTDEEYLQFENLEEMLASENLTVCQHQKLPVPVNPTFETEDLAQKIILWVNRGYNWESVTMFCKRSFLIENQIYFPKLLNDEDRIFSFCLLCSTRKFLRVPNTTYIYRQRAESVSHKKFPDLAQHFYKWFHVLRDGINEFKKFMDRMDFFSKHPDYRYAVLQFFFNDIFSRISFYDLKIPAFTLNPLVEKEFQSDTDTAMLATYLFNTVNIQRFQVIKLQQEIQKLQQQIKEKSG